MGLHHRKLTAEICKTFCHQSGSCSSDCLAFCTQKCPTIRPDYNYHYPPPNLPIIPDDVHSSKAHKISTFLIITLALLASAFLVLLCFAIYARFFSGWSRRRRSQQQTEETRDVFVDEEHGPVVYHPIWYIRTTGLQESLISEITVCKYKKGEGLIEGTECSVCLSEFQEDENLRLLPKCNHAFHLPCIDTWLRSHTNCPMCRSPIVSNQARMPVLELVDSNSVENSGTQMEILENGGESNGEMESREPEMGNENEAEEEEGQLDVEDGRKRVCEARRISVSLDSSSAAKISHALSVESGDGNWSKQLGEINEAVGSKRVKGNENLGREKGSCSFRTRSLKSVGASMKRTSSYNGNLLSWNGRSQRKQSILLRSF